MKHNFWKDLPRPILVLAPMAGYTQSPFRRLVKAIEPSTILVSELLSAKALRMGSEKTRHLAAFTPEEKGYYCVQLFGSDEDDMIEAGRIVEDMGADGIDLNFGCPSPKVVGSGYGSALLRDPVRSAQMIERLVSSTKLPVSVKMRLGFYNDEDLASIAQSFEAAGICALAIHGRTAVQKFTGTADWEPIYEVKKHLSIPVIGNGDIHTAKQAVQKLKNLDGVMIGRAALRHPWIFREVRALFDGQEIPPPPTLEQKLDLFRSHARYACDMKGEKWAMIEMRKHFAQGLRGIPHASRFRDRLIRVETFTQLEEIFAEVLGQEEPLSQSQ